MTIYRCPECGWEYDPAERAARLGLVGGIPVDPNDFVESVPFHHMPTGEPLFCEGSAEAPETEESE